MSRLGSIVSLTLLGFQQSLSMHLWRSNGVESLWSLGLHHTKRASRFLRSAFIMMRLPSSVRWRFSFQPALDLISSGVINTQAMLTAALPLEDFSRALDMVRQGRGVKTQILPNA